MRGLTHAGDVVAGQHLPMWAEADCDLGVLIPVAALGLTVRAVQLHLDLHLAVALHGFPCKQETCKQLAFSSVFLLFNSGGIINVKGIASIRSLSGSSFCP